MANLRSTYQVLRDRKKINEDAVQEVPKSVAPSAAKAPVDDTDLLSPESIEAEYRKQKAANKKKKGWLW